jgi:hypothetical protein
MNPDVARAIPPLVEAGVVPAGEAGALVRAARGELVSVHGELRALLYGGVLLIAGGVGLLVKENLDRIGPLAVALTLAVAALAALGWVVRVAPPFSWGQVASPNLAFDYVLQLGILLAAADLAYCELVLGQGAGGAGGGGGGGGAGGVGVWHLLATAGLAGVAAFRFDSRIAFSLALSSLAAWRGVSLAGAGRAAAFGSSAGVLRWNAIGCGVLFVLLGWGLARAGRKAHFEPVAVHLGWLLVLAGVAAGMGEGAGAGLAWGGALLVVGAGLAAGAWRARRFPLFAYGLVAAYAGLTRWVLEGMRDGALGCLWFAGSSLAVIVGLLAAQRRLKGARVRAEGAA